MLHIQRLFLLIVLLSLISCSYTNTEKERQRLIAAYKQERRAQVLGDFNYLAGSQTDTLLFLFEGHTQNLSKQTVRDSLRRFFKTSQYENWDDLQQPVIRVSDDASMAWIVSKVYVRRSGQNKQGTITQEQFIFNSMSAYKRHDGNWLKTTAALQVSNYVK